MAWGIFSLPCPVKKKKDNDLKNYMLGFLPTIGMIISRLGRAMRAMVWLGFPYLVLSFLVTFIPFALW